MATIIEKNTKKLIEQRLNNLFSKQQQLNGNAGSANGDVPIAEGGWEQYLVDNGLTPYGVQQPNFNRFSKGVPTYLNPNTKGYSAPSISGSNWSTELAGAQAPTANYSFQQPVKPQVPMMGFGTSPSLQGYSPYQKVPFNGTPDFSAPPVDFQGGATTTTAPGATSKTTSTTTGTTKGFTKPQEIKRVNGFTVPTDNLKSPTLATGNNPFINAPKDVLAKGPARPAVKPELDWGKVGTFAGQVAPAVYNMIKGLQRPDKVRPNYNPYESKIRSLMADRRYNIEPQLNANMTAQATTNRNIQSAGNSRGEVMGNLGASQNYRMAGDAAAWAQKNNMDNQYMAEQAQMDANLGGARANMDWNVQTAQAQNKAATNQFLGQGFNDLGKFAQTQQLMGNQAKNSQDLARIYQDMFGGITGFMPEMQKVLTRYNNKIV